MKPFNEETNKHVDIGIAILASTPSIFRKKQCIHLTMDDHARLQLEYERMGFAHLKPQTLCRSQNAEYQRCRRLFSVIERCHRGALAHSFDWLHFHVRALKATAESLDSSSDSSFSDIEILAIVDLRGL